MSRALRYYEQRSGLTSVGVGLVLVVSTILAVVYLPDYLTQQHFRAVRTQDASELLRLKTEIAKAILQLSGGTLALIGLYLAAKRMLVLDRQTDVDIQGQFSERFVKAIEHLGARDDSGRPVPERFRGGVAALERIATDSERDWLPVLKQFAAFLRPPDPAIDQAEAHKMDAERKPLNAAVLEAIRVLCACSEPERPALLRRWSSTAPVRTQGLDLRDIRLPSTDWTQCDLRGALFCRAKL